MPSPQDFDYKRGDTKAIRFTCDENGSISGFTVTFTVRRTVKQSDPPVWALTGTIEDAGSISTPGVITVTPTLVQSLELDLRSYHYSLKRTNVGFEKTLQYGVMRVTSDIYNEL